MRSHLPGEQLRVHDLPGLVQVVCQYRRRRTGVAAEIREHEEVATIFCIDGSDGLQRCLRHRCIGEPGWQPADHLDTVCRGPFCEGGDQRTAVAGMDLFGRRMGRRCHRQHRTAGRREFGGMADVTAPCVGRAGFRAGRGSVRAAVRPRSVPSTRRADRTRTAPRASARHQVRRVSASRDGT